MNRKLLLLFIISGSFGFAQNSTQLFNGTNFDTWKSAQYDSLYPIYVEQFKTDDLYTENVETYGANYLENHFTIVDFDKDGLNDIIYAGYLDGGESEHIVFLHRTKDGFERIFDALGHVVDVTPPSSSILQFTLKHSGCCEDVISNIEQYILMDLGNQPSFVLIGKYSFIDVETAAFPRAFFQKPIQFETISSQYTLRFTPEIDDSTLFTTYMTGNETALYPKGSIGVALAEKNG